MNSTATRISLNTWKQVTLAAAIIFALATVWSAVGISRSPTQPDDWTVQITLGLLQLVLFALSVAMFALTRRLAAKTRNDHQRR